MKLDWQEVDLPEFGIPSEEQPTIPVYIFMKRCQDAYSKAACDWLIVYGDREHFANITFLTGFDPRFEEALFLLGPNGAKILIVGNEGLGYARANQARHYQVILCQTFSLMGQDRLVSSNLKNILKDAGIKHGNTIGLVGWKYLEPAENDMAYPGFFIPAFIVDTLRSLAGNSESLVEKTQILMHPTTGLKAQNEVEQIAALEWVSARASRAVWRIIQGIRAGMSEFEAVMQMQYTGDPFSAHLMFASGQKSIEGLRSPTSRHLMVGDGITTAIGYWGGLCCRAGLLDKKNPKFLEQIAFPYFSGIVTWYESMRLGAKGGDIHYQVLQSLNEGGLQPMLNPGHLTSLDEWVNTPILPGSEDQLASGMAFQCDIIPVPLPDGWVINCEDTLVIADYELRLELHNRFPQTWNRIEARKDFMRNRLGIKIGDEVLPLSTIPAFLPPFWLNPKRVLIVK